MKISSSVIVLCFSFIVNSHAQQTAARSVVFRHLTSNVTIEGPYASNISQIRAYSDTTADRNSYLKTRNYKEAKFDRTIGIVMLTGGCVSLPAGVTLLAIGIYGMSNDNGGWNSGNVPAIPHIVETLFGALLTFAGTDCTIQGAIKLAKANKRIKKLKAASM